MERGTSETYARLALDQIPRLLGNQDRSPYSPTYGCFHRDYWLYKTSDFPDAVRQFSAQALAIAYRHQLPGNVYFGNSRVRDWAIAGLDFWSRVQHREGSFDEFYPYERGWVGPSGFTTYALSETYRLLEDELTGDVRTRARRAIRRAARFIASGQSEEDHLANHHAMAYLAVWSAGQALRDEGITQASKRLWQGFLEYHDHEEGWSREYDGADPGYLSAVVSFLGKVYAETRDPAIRRVLQQSVEFCSYFVYPDGHYAGMLGSRNTLHFYPHGFEVLAGEMPLAASIAERMLRALSEGKLVPPAIMSDRYVAYRVSEFLQAALAWRPRRRELAPLPYERDGLWAIFPRAGVFAATRGRHYVISNLSKGGVVKVFDRSDGRVLLTDGGLLVHTKDGRTLTSQWIDPSSERRVDDEGWEVSGSLHSVPGDQLFTPLKGLVFRLILLLVGWSPRMAHWLKGRLRRALILRAEPTAVTFRRQCTINSDAVVVVDQIRPGSRSPLRLLTVGGEFFVRYVPQSRYFQPSELDAEHLTLDEDAIRWLDSGREILVERRAGDPPSAWQVTTTAAGNEGSSWFVGSAGQRPR